MKIYEKLFEFLEKRARYSTLLILSELKNVIPTLKSMKNIIDLLKWTVPTTKLDGLRKGRSFETGRPGKLDKPKGDIFRPKVIDL